MSGKRTYDDPCGVARALELVGERWALLVVRELLLGPKRFSDLNRGLPAMSQNVLSRRLRELEHTGVVQRRTLGPPASAVVYELTDRGHDLEDVVVAMARWGSRAALTSAAQLSVDALILALKTTFDPRVAGTLRSTYELHLGADRFHAEIDDGGFEVGRGPAYEPDAVVTTDSATLRALVFGDRGLDDALRSGDAQVSGDRAALDRFVTCFARPRS
jgi:DNA-binding HxlR family transcriptional regulator